MVSLQIVFWLMVGLFGVIGYMRGWQKEVIAMTGLIASLAALSQFGFALTGFAGASTVVSDPTAAPLDLNAIHQKQFWIQSTFHLVFAFFSYQVVARIANNVSGGKIGDRVRSDLEKRIVGGLVGLVNGYLLIGGLWGFLEYELTQFGYVQLQVGLPYAFADTFIVRPLPDTAAAALAALLPMGLLSPALWLIFFFVAFFVVIVALI